MAIRSRIAAYATEATSHVVTLPGDAQVGDRVIVGFGNDQETTDTTESTGWDKLGEQGQGSTTNHSLSVFTRVLDGTANDELTVTLTDTTNSPIQQAAYVVICLVGDGGAPETVVFNDGGGNTESTGTATVGAITSLASGDYDSIIFLSLDNSDNESHVPTPPSGWGNLTTSSTTSTHALFTYSMDQSASGVTGFSPASISFTNQEQWVTAHVVVAQQAGVTGTGSADFGFTAAATGTVTAYGTGSADFGFTARAATPVDGTGSADFGFAASATGVVTAYGTAEADFGFTAAATGIGVMPGVAFLTDELGLHARLLVEIAWGADLTADSTTWEWTDITADVRNDPGISTKLGRGNEAATSQPARCTMTLDNTGSKYSIGGHSPNWPNVRRNTPVRIRINPDDGSSWRTVFYGFADGFTPTWDSLRGDIPAVKLSASGSLRRIQQGDAPILSAYRRAMTSLDSVVSYWPMEEGRDATYAPAERGGEDLIFEAGRTGWGQDDTFNSSAPLPAMRDGWMTANLDPYTDTGENQVRFLAYIPEDQPDGSVLIHIHMSGTIARWDITYEIVNGAQCLGLFRYTDSAFHSSDIISFGLAGVPGRISLELTQNGSNIDWLLGWKDALTDDSALFFDDTITGEDAGIVTNFSINSHQHLGELVMGHITVQNEITSLFTEADALVANVGDTVAGVSTGRLQRLTTENQVDLNIHGSGETISDYDRLGPQLVAPLLDLLRECETADQGQLWDGLDAGLSYTTRRRRESATAALVIDASAGQLARGFAPTDDDQLNRNRVTATRLQGITSTYEDTNGRLGTAAIGIYDSAVEVNNRFDFMTPHYASWLVHLGTHEGYRYPTVTLNMRATPTLAGDALDIIPGERIDIVNLDDTLTGFPIGTVSLLVEGISHQITATTWEMTFQCSPFEPWAVGRVAEESGDTSEFLLRLDTAGSTLASAASVGATSISVATTSGPLWTTDADDYPLALSVGGIPVIATACSGASSPQTFTVEALPLARAAGVEVRLHDPRPLSLG